MDVAAFWELVRQRVIAKQSAEDSSDSLGNSSNKPAASYASKLQHVARQRRLPPQPNIHKAKTTKYKKGKKQHLLRTAHTVSTFQCCTAHCTAHLQQPIVPICKQYAQANEKGRVQQLLTFLKTSQNPNTRRWRYQIHGQSVCTAAVCKIFGCSLKKFNKVKRLSLMGRQMIVHGNLGQTRCSSLKLQTVTWLSSFLHSIGEKMPSGDWHIPMFLSWGEVHAVYCQEVVPKHYGRTAFKACLTKNFPKVNNFSTWFFHCLENCLFK